MKKFLSSLLKGLAYFAVYAALQAGVSVYAGFIIAFMPNGIASFKDVLSQNINLILVISGIITLLTFIMMLKAQRLSLKQELALKPVAFARLLPLIIGGIALNFLVSSGMELLPIPESLLNDYNETSGMLLKGSPAWQLISVIIMAPVVEEVTFRGLMLGRFSKGMNIILAGFIQAALFGVMHGSPIWIAYGFLIGLLLGAVMMLYRSLFACIVLHMSFNSASYFVELVPTTNTLALVMMLFFSLVICVAMALVIIKFFKKQQPEPV